MDTHIIEALKWRYATKQFDTEKKVNDSDINTLLEVMRLAPSSQGLLPWKAFLVADEKIRGQLKAAAWNQAQLTDASHLIVFTARKDIDEHYIDSYLKEVVKQRNQKWEDIQGYRNMLLGSIAGKTPEKLFEWNARQAYISLGFLLEAAALMKIDACPMEGFDTAQFDAILKLNETEYRTVVIAAVGYRSTADKYALAQKVRFAKDEVIKKI
ncbi:MAG: NAD(P)H-dependent oxidoreductase [Microgenomates group bacterium]